DCPRWNVCAFSPLSYDVAHPLAAHLQFSDAKDILAPVYDRFTEGVCDRGHADHASPARLAPAFRMVRWHQTSDAQLRIGESRDSGFDASHRPGMTATTPRSRGAMCPSCARTVRPKKSEGAGNAGRAMHPQPRVQMKKVHEHSHHGHTGTTRHSPRNGFTAYFALSPVTMLV